MDSPQSDSTKWFAAEVQPHEPVLRSYLRGAFPSVRDVDDVVQESYLRVWRARAAQPIESARAFLFRVARNIALDLVRRDRRAQPEQVGDFAGLNVVDESSDVRHGVVTRECIALLAESLDALPHRQRQLVILCKLQGLSHRDAAVQLGLAEKTVTEHVYRGVQRLGEELQRRGVDRFAG